MTLAVPDPLCHFIRVLLDGRDVTGQCFYASEERGEAGLYLANSEGQFYLSESGEVAWVQREGEVRVLPLPWLGRLRVAWSRLRHHTIGWEWGR